MAMSMRSRGAAAANRSRSGVRPVYEDFKPTSEWKHEEGADLLLFHLPGFSKEQIRILAESKGLLRVRGQRHIAGNKWSRFEEEVMVPEDCNIAEIRAKFESGILQITMPKKKFSTNEKKPTKEQSKTTPYQQEHELPGPSLIKPDLQPKPQPLKEQEVPSKPQLATSINPSLTEPEHQKLGPPLASMIGKIKEQSKKTQHEQEHEHELSRPSVTKPRFQPKPQPLNDHELPSKPQFGTIINPPLSTRPEGVSEPEPKKLGPELPSILGNFENQLGSQATMPPFLKPQSDLKQSKKREETFDYKKPKAIKDHQLKSKDKVEHQEISTSLIQEDETYADAFEHHDKAISKEMKETYGFEDYKRAIRSHLPRNLDEDRQLLMNMGVAVLVIMALGACISYSFTSSG